MEAKGERENDRKGYIGITVNGFIETFSFRETIICFSFRETIICLSLFFKCEQTFI